MDREARKTSTLHRDVPRNQDEPRNVDRRRKSLPRGRAYQLVIQYQVCSVLKSYLQVALYRLSSLLRNVTIYTNVHATIIDFKKAMNLKESKEYMGGFRRKKVKGGNDIISKN